MKRRIIDLSFIAIILFIYKSWFISWNIIGGDWPYVFQDTVNTFPFLPPAWDPTRGNGLGGTFLVYALDSYLYFIGWFFSHLLHIPWPFVYKFFYFGMFLFLGIFSIWYTLKKLLPQLPPVYRSLGIFLYVANSYILLIASGGQMGIALAYSIAPLVLARFIMVVSSLKSSSHQVIKSSILAGLLFAVEVMFDVRLAYITILAVIFYLLFNYGLRIANHDKLKITNSELRIKSAMRNAQLVNRGIIFVLLIPLLITGLLHAFWILPLIFGGQNPVDQVGSIYTTTGAVKFFSFAKLENSLSLLHPNWPENLFGKVYFMKWEFLLLPILAYSSLLFINSPIAHYALRIKKHDKESEINNQQSNNRLILFFALLGLLGAFLAKGANDPFGGIYLWMFDHVPGFVMFRDPTKFYIMIALSYSILVPFSVYSIYEWLRKKFDN